MFGSIMNFFKRFGKNEKENSKEAAKERLHLVLAQDRANISADFLEMMKQEIIEVIKKYIDIDEEAIDVRMTNKPGEDGTVGAPALYANIPIVTIKNEARKLEGNAQNKKQEGQAKNIQKNQENINTEEKTQCKQPNENTQQEKQEYSENKQENKQEAKKEEKEESGSPEVSDETSKVETKNIQNKKATETQKKNTTAKKKV